MTGSHSQITLILIFISFRIIAVEGILNLPEKETLIRGNLQYHYSTNIIFPFSEISNGLMEIEEICIINCFKHTNEKFLSYFRSRIRNSVEPFRVIELGQIPNEIGINKRPGVFSLLILSPYFGTNIAHSIYFVIIVLFVFFLFRVKTKALRNSNKNLREKEIIAKEVKRQKDILDRRNKNIEDSLNYAQRIQKAMLSTNKQFNIFLPDSFIFHKSKDIVSGDFFWISQVEDKIFLAAVDCTGHGVPGAFMSLIGFELFRKIINTQNVHQPAEILNSLNQNFNEIFGGKEGNILQYGMDLAFVVFNRNKNYLEFAGAFNPLYIIRDNKLIEIKGDRFSIGAEYLNGNPVTNRFTNHKVILRQDDMIYLFSDGYADQFGGPEGKKFKYRRLRHLLLTIHKFSIEKQKSFLEETMDEWKGNSEQVDDILIIGFRHKMI